MLNARWTTTTSDRTDRATEVADPEAETLRARRAEELLALDASQLVSVYVGRAGRCACGCSGKHRYWDAAEGTEARGYEVAPSEVNRAYVRRTLRTIQEHADEAARIDEADLGDGPIWSWSDEERMYVAYVRA